MLLRVSEGSSPTGMREEIYKLSGERVENCIACGKCSSGCAIAPFMDLLPHQVIRLSAMGAEKVVLSSKSIWLCVTCEACTSRCPESIDIARVMDTLRKLSIEKGYRPGEKSVYEFNEKFLNSIKKFGRVFELGFMIDFYKKNPPLRGIKENILLALDMFKKGKLPVKPHSVKEKLPVLRAFEKSRRFLESGEGGK